MDGRVFLFAANPDHWDVREQLKKVRPGHIEEWAANQHRAKMRTGDIVLLWSFMGAAKVDSGIYAVGRIVAPPRKHATNHGKHAVWWVVTEVLGSPIHKDAITSARGLEKSVFTKPMQGTNFLLSGAESKALFSAFPQLSKVADVDATKLAVTSLIETLGLREKSKSIMAVRGNQTWLAIRRYRVAQIRKIFEKGRVEWQTFHRGVWRLGGINVEGRFIVPLDNRNLPFETIDRLLADGTLDCGGNTLWAAATGILAPNSTPDERDAAVEKLRKILISDVPPIEKYHALKGISGLGPSVSSGFMAIFHPESWALRTAPTIAVLDRLHLDSTELGFLKSSNELLHQLGLSDFLELDMVLYALPSLLKAPTQYWWANLGKNHEDLLANSRLVSADDEDGTPSDLLRVNPDDVIYGYWNQAVRAKLIALTSAAPVASTDDESSSKYEVRVRFEETDVLPIDSIMRDGPAFDKSGNPLPGYIFPLRNALVVKQQIIAESESKFIKVAPWMQAEFWPKCLEERGMVVGWAEIGDLKQYQSVDDLRVAMSREYSQTENNEVPFYRFSEDLWTYRNLKPGDVIVANKGKSQVLGVGVVQAPGYQFREELDPAPNFVPVEWDVSYAKKIPRQDAWQQTIVRDISPELRKLILEPLAESTTPEASSNAQAFILHGPPGTGKTFVTRRRAVDLVIKTPIASTELNTVFSDLSASGRIRFITFHQSFGYEEFVEGIRPATNENDQSVSFEVQPGVFARLALHAAAAGVKKIEAVPTFESLWSTLLDEIQTETVENGHYWIDAPGGRRYLAESTPTGNIKGRQWREVDGLVEPTGAFLAANKSYARALWARRDDLGDNYSYSLVSRIVAEERGTGGGCHGNMLWWAIQKLLHLADAAVPGPASLAERLEIAQDLLEGHSAEGEFDFDGADQYVLIIDEINRGNISKILGELITLLEPSKRLTKDDELVVRLPYSGRAFGVPPNLHVIGTMNTADRSIALLDVALRRRFKFEEIMPDAGVLRAVLPGRVEDHVDQPDEFVDLVVSVFEKINKRVQFLYDRDHMIGHAYYLQATDHAAFRDVLVKSVIPLLQEYFYGSWDLVCTALGCPYYEDGKARRSSTAYAHALVEFSKSPQMEVLGFDHDDFEDKLEFFINPMFLKDEATPEDLEAFFKGIL